MLENMRDVRQAGFRLFYLADLSRLKNAPTEVLFGWLYFYVKLLIFIQTWYWCIYTFPGIVQLPDLTRIFDFILFEDDIKRFSYLPSFPPLQRMCWQTMANLCVQNVTTQSMIWSHFGHKVIEATRHSSSYTNIQIMILFNIFQSGNIQSYDKTIFEVLITKLSENPNDTCEFSEIFLEYFLTSYHRVVFLYGTLADQDRIMVLYYIAEYVRNSTPERRVNHSLLTYISKELKKKSDCILRTHNASDVEHLRPREVLALLDVIALASGMEIYSEIYCNDHSLFLNVGGLLQQLKAIGESSQNIFTPMKKLEQVAPNSKISSDFETEISFRLKTTLVRILANLSYKNRKNQEYARETGIIMAILDCTSADGRNPCK